MYSYILPTISPILFGSDFYSAGTIQLYPGNLPRHLCDDLDVKSNKPGLVRLQAKHKYFNLPSDYHCANHFTHYWVDNNGDLLHTQFLRWFNEVVDQALNQLPICQEKYHLMIGTELYLIKKRACKRGYSINITCSDRFSFDVDLLPALKFPEHRWPPANDYREIPHKSKAESWLAIPISEYQPKSPSTIRSWQVMLDTQEARFLHDHFRLHQTMSLVEKVRNALKMKEISDYHVKTLFLWETENTEIFFWDQSIDFLFKTMLWRLYDAVRCGCISFFWNSKRNIIKNVKGETLQSYEQRLKMLLHTLQEPNTMDDLAHVLLTGSEYWQLYGFRPFYVFEQKRRIYGHISKYIYVE